MEEITKTGSNRSGTGTKGKPKGPYRFSPDVAGILATRPRATAFLEDATRVLSWLDSRPDLRQLLADAAFEQIQPLQAAEQYDPKSFTPEMRAEKELLDKVWDRLRTK
ncbi:hypothetical protein [Spirosoma sp. KUDC1026]|uniref:hypothetical protein n=1 Tax=Spirosoma sp. KUDC1026 TaxID=2745947 RepID=UPI00159BE2B2|nr:hypothetical protein [Spirosoma sp. KUDC1026]QKZ15171.1 hypothetical protein HU175_22120 [Spirosoma sp. KUDC1026]